MSYGSKVFIPPDRRLQSDLGVLYNEMRNEEIRASLEKQLAKIDPALDKKVQDLANRYHSGTNSKHVLTELKRLKTNKLLDLPSHDNSSGIEFYHSKSNYTNTTPAPNHDNSDGIIRPLITAKELDAHGDIHGHHTIINHHPLHVTHGLLLHNQRIGQSFHVPNIVDPYEPYLQNSSSSSAYNLNTPKMWSSATEAPCKSYQLIDKESLSAIDTHSFGKPSYSITLKQQLKQQRGKLPDPPTISARPCSISKSLPTTSRARKVLKKGGHEQDHRRSHSGSSNDSPQHSSNHSYAGEQQSNEDSHTSQPLSVLQNTLIQCGKLQIADTLKNIPLNKQIDRSLAVQQLGMIKHSKWLRNINNNNNNNNGSSINSDISTHSYVDAVSLPTGNNSAMTNSIHIKSDVSKTTMTGWTDHDLYHKIYQKATTIPTTLPINSTKHKLHIKLHDKLQRSNTGTAKEVKNNYSIKSDLRNHSVGSNESKVANHPNGSNGSYNSSNYSTVNSTAVASSSLSTTISIPNANNSNNPYRKQRRPRSVMGYSRVIPRAPNLLDPLDYKDEMSIHARGNFNVAVKPSISIGTVPSKSEVNHILESLTRKAVLSYNTRIVECGSALKAMKDPKHPTPGLEAIFSLHKAFINAASSNTNNWLLNRNQISEVLTNHIPWLPSEGKHRLLLSFDTQNTGIIKYVRISTTFLCCSEPAMIELCTTLNRAFNHISKKAAGAIEGGEENIFDCLGELVLISLIHGFYEECSGGTVLAITATQRKKAIENLAVMSGSDLVNQDRNYTRAYTNSDSDFKGKKQQQKEEEENNRIGVGMRLQDFVEAFSCCASCIEDEVEISRLAVPVMQYLFDRGLNQPPSNISSHNISSKSVPPQSLSPTLYGTNNDINNKPSKSKLFLEHDEQSVATYGGNIAGRSVSVDSFTDLSMLEMQKGEKLIYKYKNGEHTITRGDKASILTHPLRTNNNNNNSHLGLAAARGNSINEIINEPMNWKNKLSLPSNYYYPNNSSSNNHNNNRINNQQNNSSSLLLPGGNSIVWKDSGNTVNSGYSTTAASVTQSKIYQPLTHNSSYHSPDHLMSPVIDVQHILKHNGLASIKNLPRFSKDELIDALKKYPKFLKEFVRQIRYFREAAKPYIYFGSRSIEDSINQFNLATNTD